METTLATTNTELPSPRPRPVRIVGEPVRCFHDDGRGGCYAYGVVTRAGTRQFSVVWESGIRQRFPQGFSLVEEVPDEPTSRELADEAIARIRAQYVRRDWRGKTVYRRCTCGETAHDARTVLGADGRPAGFEYACRNCHAVLLSPPDGRHREATPAARDLAEDPTGQG
jgi:hypothetical protein